MDATKPEVAKVCNFLDELLPREDIQLPEMLQQEDEFSFQQLPCQNNSIVQQDYSLDEIRTVAQETRPIIKSRPSAKNVRPPKQASRQDARSNLIKNKTFSRVTFQ